VLAAVAFTLVTAASCSSKAPSAIVPASSSPATTAAAAAIATTAAKAVAPATTAAPAVATTISSGDPVIDAVGTDLDAFEKESDGLSNAAAATQEVTK
jgi:predicted lipoprotein with Yx(FWY)xxD motif